MICEPQPQLLVTFWGKDTVFHTPGLKLLIYIEFEETVHR
jgi:hypothetical protein